MTSDMKKVFYLLSAILLISLYSCGTTYDLPKSILYETHVNSFGNYNLDGSTYYVRPSDTNLSPDDLEFQSYAKLLENTLLLSGAKRVMTLADADMVVEMGYDIADSSYDTTEAVPIYGKTGISSVTTDTKVEKSIDGSEKKTTTTHYDHDYGVTGYANVNRHITSYDRSINIFAYDNRSEGHKMIWKTILSSNGAGSNFRRVASYMLFSAWDRMARDYNETIAVYEDDYVFRSWEKGVLLDDNITTFPEVVNMRCAPGCEIAMVERMKNETIIVLKYNVYGKYRISPYISIDLNGKHYQATGADNIVLGKSFMNNGATYVRLHFPAIPARTDEISLVEYKDKKFKEIGSYWMNFPIN